MKKLIFYLCLTLSFTNLSLARVASAEFTLFNLLILVVGVLFFVPKVFENKISSPRFYWALFFLIVFVNLLFIGSIKVTSFVYSLIILVELLILYNVSSKINNELIIKINKAVILLYFINISFTMLLILVGAQGFLRQIFQYFDFAGQVRPQGFSSEPSYAAIICAFSLLLLMKVNNFKITRSNVSYYVFAIVSILLTQSSYGIIYLLILFCVFMSKNKLLSKKAIVIAPFVVLILLFGLSQIEYSDSSSIQRLVVISDFIFKSNGSFLEKIKLLNSVDSSASFRVLPIIEMFNYYSNTSILHVLFGNGAGQASNYFRSVFELSTEESDASLGFFPSFVYNYGLVGTSVAATFFYWLLPKEKILACLLLALVLFNADFNTQFFLYILFTFILIKRFDQNIWNTNKSLVK